MPYLTGSLEPYAILECEFQIILLRYIYHRDYQWPWSSEDLLRVAIHQRGYTDRPYERLALQRMYSEGYTIARGGNNDKDEMMTTLYLERAGMSPRRPRDRVQDPRTALISWAVQKAEDHAVGIHPSTIKMLCKAEARTAQALMNSRSPSQTRHILEAAFRRASLTFPTSSQQPTGAEEQQQQQPVDLTGQIADSLLGICNMLGMQTQMLTTIMNNMAAIPGQEHHQALMDMFTTTQNANIAAVTAFANAMNNIERRIASWEDRLQELTHNTRQDQGHDDAATSVYSTPGLGEEPDTQEYMDAEEEQRPGVYNDDEMEPDPEQQQTSNASMTLTTQHVIGQTILIDDDHDEDGRTEGAVQTDEHEEVRPSILDTLAQRSEASLARGRAVQPFGAPRQ